MSPTTNPTELLAFDAAAVADAICVSKRWLYQQISAGNFPKADVVLSESMPRWSRALVLQWIEQRRQTQEAAK